MNKNIFMKTSKRLISVSALALTLCGCALDSGGPYKGEVVEEGTGKGIEGAWVAVTWEMNFGSTAGGGGGYPCYHIEIARTDKDGKYYVPRWSVDHSKAETPSILKTRVSPLSGTIVTRVYMPGYTDSRKEHSDMKHAVMARFTGTPEERLRELELIQFGCELPPPGWQKNLIPALAEIKAEGMQHPDSKQKKTVLRNYNIHINVIKGLLAREQSGRAGDDGLL